MTRRYFAPLLSAAALLMLAPAPAAGQALSGAARDEPLPRFNDPLCPGVIGLKVDVAEAVIGRIRQNAEQIGLPLANELSCEPNVIATFVADGKGYVTRLAEDDSWMFRDMTAEERKALFDQAGNVRAWTRTVVRTRDGMTVSRRDNLMDIPQTAMWMAHSKIYVPTRRDVIAAMVLFDRDAIDGLSVFQMADYITMRALAGEAFKDIPPPGGTILTLFEDPEARASELTRYDLAFLDTLYSTMPNVPAAVTLATARKKIAAASIAE
jgi:hypothetical protein